MALLFITHFALVAVVVEIVWRSSTVDEKGNVYPSLRDIARARRAAKRAAPTGEGHGRGSISDR